MRYLSRTVGLGLWLTDSGVTMAEIAYAGTAPQGVAGFFQVNAKVPANARSGAVPVLITVGPNKSQAGVTVAIR